MKAAPGLEEAGLRAEENWEAVEKISCWPACCSWGRGGVNDQFSVFFFLSVWPKKKNEKQASRAASYLHQLSVGTQLHCTSTLQGLPLEHALQIHV